MSMPLTTPGAHDPDALVLIGRAFDNAWDEVASRSVIANPIGLSKTINRRKLCAVDARGAAKPGLSRGDRGEETHWTWSGALTIRMRTLVTLYRQLRTC